MKINPFPPTPPFFPVSNSLLNSLPPPLQSLRGMGNEATLHVVSATPSSSGGGLLTLIPCSRVGSLSWERVFHGLLQHKPFLHAAVHRLLHRVHKFFHRVQSFRNTLLQQGSLTGSQVLPESGFRVDFPWDHSLLLAPMCSSVGSSTGYRWISPLPQTSMGFRGTACFTVVFTTACGAIAALAPGSPSLSFFTDLGVCRAVSLTHSLVLVFCSFPLFLTLLSQVLQSLLIGLVLAKGVYLGVSWHWLSQM